MAFFSRSVLARLRPALFTVTIVGPAATAGCGSSDAGEELDSGAGADEGAGDTSPPGEPREAGFADQSTPITDASPDATRAEDATADGATPDGSELDADDGSTTLDAGSDSPIVADANLPTFAPDGSAPDATSSDDAGADSAGPLFDAGLDAPSAPDTGPVVVETLSFTELPAEGFEGAALGPVTLAAFDGGAAIDSTFAQSVTVRLASSPAPGVASLGGTLTVNAVNGVATLADLTINQPGTYALVATSGTLTTTSPTFTVAAPSVAWTPSNGDATGTNVVAGFAFSGGTVFASTGYGGVYRKAESPPSSWSFEGLTSAVPASLVADASGRLFAANIGVVTSIDRGATWARLVNAPAGAGLGPLVVDPSAPSTVYLASSDGIYRTTDSGQTWALILAPASGAWIDVWYIAVAPTSSQTLYAVVDGPQGLQGLVSVNAGATWNALPSLPASGGTASALGGALAVDSTDSTILYAGTEPDGLYKLANGSWSKVPGLPNNEVRVPPVIRPAGQTSYVVALGSGLWTSSDGGQTWRQVATVPSSAVTLGVDPQNPLVAYVGVDDATDGRAIFQTNDGGATWADGTAGMQAFTASVAVAASDPSVLYFGGGGAGPYRSNDNGKSWGALPPTSTPGGLVAVAVSSTDANLLYGAGWNGVFAFADTTSSAAPALVYSGNVRTYALAPSDDQSAYATGELFNANNLFVTANGGSSWSTPTVGQSVVWVTIDPTNASVAYSVFQSTTTFAESLQKTTDHGADWSPIAMPNGLVDVLAVSPANDLTLYAEGAATVYTSANGGSSWTAVGSLPAGAAFSAMAIDPVTPATIYAAGTYGGLWRSVNSGQNWALFGFPYRNIQSIAIDPVTPTNIYVGVQQGGVFRTSTGGL